MSFANRVTLITGAGSGIGRQLACELAGRGALIAALDLQPEPLQSLQAELTPARCQWAVGDVTERVVLQQAVRQLEAQLGPTELLIANAGIGREMSALHFSASEFEAQIRVNLLGVANSIDAVLPGMLERRRGHVVGISSLASYRGIPKMFAYCASKAGVNALLDGVRAETRAWGLHVTTICPGWIRTPLTAHLELPDREVLEVTTACRRMADAIARRREFYAFPTKTAWLVALLRALPTWLSDRLVNRALQRNQRSAQE